MTKTSYLQTTLSRLRDELDATRDELARHIGTTSRTLARWESGESVPRSSEHAQHLIGLTYIYLDEALASDLASELGHGDYLHEAREALDQIKANDDFEGGKASYKAMTAKGGRDLELGPLALAGISIASVLGGPLGASASAFLAAHTARKMKDSPSATQTPGGEEPDDSSLSIAQHVSPSVEDAKKLSRHVTMMARTLGVDEELLAIQLELFLQASVSAGASLEDVLEIVALQND